jgi:hypothetical protein
LQITSPAATPSPEASIWRCWRFLRSCLSFSREQMEPGTVTHEPPNSIFWLFSETTARISGYNCQRGHPLVGPCQASKQSHGGASRQFFQLLHTSLAIADRTRFFKVWLRTNRASHPSGSSDQRWSAFALAVFAAPEERWCRFVSNGFHRLVAAGFPAPTPGWLTLQAIRLTARVTANGSPFRLVARCPGPLPGLPPPS